MRSKNLRKNTSSSPVPSNSDNKDEIEDKQTLIEHVKKTRDDSSAKNRNLSIFFYVFSLYILLSTLGTSDVMLLLPENSFQLPFINIELDLLSFYVLAPLLLLAFHYNLLFNYNMHLQKLKKYELLTHECAPEHVNPSHYDFAFYLGTTSIRGLVINLFLWILIYLLPLSILLLIYIRFVDYHDELITGLHFVTVIFDLSMIAVFITINREFLKDDHVIKNEEIGFSFRRLKGTVLRFIRMSSRGIGYITLSLILVSLCSYHMIFFQPLIVSGYDIGLASRLEKTTSNEYNSSTIKDGTLIPFTDSPFERVLCGAWRWFPMVDDDCIPRLTVREKDMVRISENSMYLPRAFSKDDVDKSIRITEEQLVLKYGSRIELSGRNLRYADMEGVVLTRADLKASDFQGARLVASQLQGAVLEGAKFNGANLSFAQLEGARLSNSYFEDTVFIMANLQKAVMAGAFFTWARFDSAELQGAYIYQSDLNGTVFNRANLEGARLSESDLVGSSLWSANLTGVRVWGSDINATSLLGAIMIGTSFEQVDMNGVDLSYSDLRDASFNDVNMSVVNLYKTRFCGNIFDMNISGFYKNKDTDYEKNVTRLAERKRNPPLAIKAIADIQSDFQMRSCKQTNQNNSIFMCRECPDEEKQEIEETLVKVKKASENIGYFMEIVSMHIDENMKRLENKDTCSEPDKKELTPEKEKKIEEMLSRSQKVACAHSLSTGSLDKQITSQKDKECLKKLCP